MDNIPREDLDVRINVYDNAFEVHKGMLIRSLTVFKGMLECNIEKNKSSNLAIMKMTPVSFKDLMNYLCDKLNENDMLKYSDALPFAADRYNIVCLKEYYKDRVFQEVLLSDEVLKHLRNFELH